MPKIQHRQKIEFNIWVEDKNSVDYYLMDKQFIDCFTSIKVRYKTIYEDNFEPGHNFIIIPIESLQDVPEDVSNQIKAFSNEHDVKIIIACGSKTFTWSDDTLAMWREHNKIPDVKIFVNGLVSDNDIIAVPSYISKLYNWYGEELEDEFLHSFNVLADEINFKFSVQFGKMNETKKEVLKELFDQQVFQNCDSFWHTLHVNDIEEGRKFYKENTNSTNQIVDKVYNNEIFHIDKYTEKDWWATYPWQLKFSCLNLAIEDTSIPTITEHILKSLMLGQPVVWIAYPKLLDYLNELGFTTYPWMKYDFDYIVDKSKRIKSAIKEVKRQALNPEFILYTRKHTYWTNKKNKENFNRLAREDICLDKFLEKIN